MLCVEPHSDPQKATTTGVAAHILGAREGAARYDPSQTHDERASIGNGIWVCHSCSDKIDKDQAAYPPDLLRRWKADHEAWVGGKKIIPSFPVIALRTIDGLAVGPGTTIVAEAANRFRDHVLSISTGSRHEIVRLTARIQFPETVVYLAADHGPGTEVAVEQDEMIPVAKIEGSGEVKVAPESKPSPLLVLKIDRLLPGRPVSLMLRTEKGWSDEQVHLMEARLGVQLPWTFILMSFLYRHLDHYFERDCLFLIATVGDRSYICEPPVERGQLLFRIQGWSREVTLTAGPQGSVRVMWHPKEN